VREEEREREREREREGTLHCMGRQGSKEGEGGTYAVDCCTVRLLAWVSGCCKREQQPSSAQQLGIHLPAPVSVVICDCTKRPATPSV
jgi:hypothetical protein